MAVIVAFSWLLGCSDGPTGGSLESGDSGDVVSDSAVFPTTSDAQAAPYVLPIARGPHAVGTRRYEWVDKKRDRKVPVRVWYPAKAKTGQPVTYLFVLKGDALQDAAPDDSAGPYPTVLFSHGFRGAAEQSFSITEHVASWGYFVVAPDHVTNTLMDFNASDEDSAQVAIERPFDMQFAHAAVAAKTFELNAVVDSTRAGVMGHSFGGWTALTLGGAQVHIKAANTACKAGAASDIMCKYTALLPDDSVIRPTKDTPGLRAIVTLAPGGHSSFGNTLADISAPTLVLGGTRDETTTLATEIDPIFADLPGPKARGVLVDGSHMSFTNVCSLSFAKTLLKDTCVVPGQLPAATADKISRTLVVAWFDRFIKQDARVVHAMSSEALAEALPKLIWTAGAK